MHTARKLYHWVTKDRVTIPVNMHNIHTHGLMFVV